MGKLTIPGIPAWLLPLTSSVCVCIYLCVCVYVNEWTHNTSPCPFLCWVRVCLLGSILNGPSSASKSRCVCVYVYLQYVFNYKCIHTEIILCLEKRGIAKDHLFWPFLSHHDFIIYHYLEFKPTCLWDLGFCDLIVVLHSYTFRNTQLHRNLHSQTSWNRSEAFMPITVPSSSASSCVGAVQDVEVFLSQPPPPTSGFTGSRLSEAMKLTLATS